MRRACVGLTCLVAAVLLPGTHSAPARGAEPASAADLCVVRVEDPAAAGSIEAEQPHRYLWGSYTFPGSPLIVLRPQRRGNWTLSDDRRFVPLANGAPTPVPAFPTASAQNDFALEAHSGRVLGITSGRGVWALPPGGERFAAHRPEQWPELSFLRTGTMAYVPAWRATVFGGAAGLFAARDDEPFAPVPGPDGFPLGDVTRAVAVPGRGAAVVGTFYGRVGLVTGEGGPERVRWLFSYPPVTKPGMGGFGQGSDDVAEVLPLPRPDTFLVRGGRHAHVLALPSGTGERAGEAAVEEVERAPSGTPSTSTASWRPAPASTSSTSPSRNASGSPHEPACSAWRARVSSRFRAATRRRSDARRGSSPCRRAASSSRARRAAACSCTATARSRRCPTATRRGRTVGSTTYRQSGACWSIRTRDPSS